MVQVRRSRVKKRSTSPEARRLEAAEELTAQVRALIEKQMERQNLSQSELARRMGVTQPRANQIVGGDNFTIKSMAQIFLALGCRLQVKVVPDSELQAS